MGLGVMTTGDGRGRVVVFAVVVVVVVAAITCGVGERLDGIGLPAGKLASSA